MHTIIVNKLSPQPRKRGMANDVIQAIEHTRSQSILIQGQHQAPYLASCYSSTPLWLILHTMKIKHVMSSM